MSESSEPETSGNEPVSIDIFKIESGPDHDSTPSSPDVFIEPFFQRDLKIRPSIPPFSERKSTHDPFAPFIQTPSSSSFADSNNDDDDDAGRIATSPLHKIRSLRSLSRNIVINRALQFIQSARIQQDNDKFGEIGEKLSTEELHNRKKFFYNLSQVDHGTLKPFLYMYLNMIKDS